MATKKDNREKSIEVNLLQASITIGRPLAWQK